MFHSIQFRFYDFKCRFCHRIVIGASFMTQGSPDMKRFQQFLNGLVFEFISAVCVEQAYIFKASFHALESRFYKLCRFMFSRTVSYDFPVIEVNKNTYVIPVCPYPYIRQIAYYDIPVFPVLKLTVQDIFRL